MAVSHKPSVMVAERMVGEQPAGPSIEVQSLRSDAQEDAFGGPRTVWRVTTSVEREEETNGNVQQVAYVREYFVKAEAELPENHDDILALMDENPIPSADTGEPKVFYSKKKDDCYRFPSERATGDAKRQAQMIQKVLKTAEVPQVQYMGEKEAVIRVWEETEEYRTIVDSVSGGSDVDVERKMRYWASKLQERPGGDIMECGLRWAVEARRKKRGEEKKEQEQEEQEQRAENTDEPEVTGRAVEVRTGRGSAGLVRGGDERHCADESSRKGKGKGNGGKGEHGSKGGAGSKGTQQVENSVTDEDQEDKRTMRDEREEGGGIPLGREEEGREDDEEGRRSGGR